jgi:hypothetical protein
MPPVVLERPVLLSPNECLIGRRKRLEPSSPNSSGITLEDNLAIRPFCGATEGMPSR